MCEKYLSDPYLSVQGLQLVVEIRDGLVHLRDALLVLVPQYGVLRGGR